MKLNFKQSVYFRAGKELKNYRRGDHDLSDEELKILSKDEHFLRYRKLGLIQDSSKKATSSTESLLERNKKLLNKVIKPTFTKAKAIPSVSKSADKFTVSEKAVSNSKG